MPPRPITRLRKLCLALPEAHEVEAWGAPTFRVRNKIFAMFASAATHHGDGRPGVWCATAPMTQDLLLRSEPRRFFVPPYVGKGGWVGIYLDDAPDWFAVADILRESYRRIAPKRLAAQLPPDP
ncbi:MAG: MmcQ/YjbR family DNA-binding protein [Gemmatimonadota bacterium]|nr:MmcQ/YjbR family DNA-binding protein [Gemmatimonadota bacterium]